MIEVARVISIKDSKAKVEVKGSGGCGSSCGGCKGCSAAVSPLVEVDNTIGVKVGQEVKIEMRTEGYYKALLLLYGFPIVMLIVGIVSGIKIGEALNVGSSKELIGAAFGIGLWIGAHYITKLADKKFKLSNKVKYVIKDAL